jgi:general secretion pathway protein J
METVPTYRRQNGFTLIEVLIAMTLLGIMVVLLFSTLRIAAESWNAGESKTVEVNKKAVVYQFFKRHLTTARPVNMPITNPDETQPSLAFQGSMQHLVFVASLPSGSARKGWQIFEIGVDPNQQSTIMVALTPYQPTANPQLDKVPLVTHVKNYAFSYFGVIDATSGSGIWVDQWAGMDHLPVLIKVRIMLDDNSYWPDMVFPVRINTQSSGAASPPANNGN